LAALLLAGAAVVGAGLSAQIVHRLSLYVHEYNGQTGLNHVADGFFLLVYSVGLPAALSALGSACLVRGRAWRWPAGSLAAVNLALCIAFVAMHRTGVLVEYSEFVHRYGP
jgi:hypothetical protein